MNGSSFQGKTTARTALRRSGAAGQRRGVGARRPVGAPAAGGADGAEVQRPQAARVGWREAISVTVSGLGYELVDVERGQRGLLRVYIDRVPGYAYTTAGEFVTVEDCEQVTRQLQYVLEVEALDYARLEVSSPGLDRPLKSEADFERFAGQAVSLTLKVPFQGRKVWQGLLGRAEGGGWQLGLKEGKTERTLDFVHAEVREARLVPVVDFKGRKSVDGGRAGEAPGQVAAPGADGG